MKAITPDEMDWERAREARTQSIEKKFLAGLDLFDLACTFARAGIRNQHPDANDEQVEEILRKRIALGRRLEDGS